jgi:hypothetical protein
MGSVDRVGAIDAETNDRESFQGRQSTFSPKFCKASSSPGGRSNGKVIERATRMQRRDFCERGRPNERYLARMF